MGRYAITAANHTNPDNHCASSFKVWEYNANKKTWHPLGGKNIDFVNDLLKHGHEVLSANIDGDKLFTGVPVEIELRIAKNETRYKISEMPTF